MAGRVLALPQRSALLDAFVQITQNQRAHPYVSASYASCQLCVNWRVVFPHCTLYIMFYGVLSPLLSSMSDGGRNSHLSPHSTGKPQKTIVGCWRSLNIDPDSFGLHLGGKKSAAGKHKIQLFSDWTGSSRDAHLGSPVPGDLCGVKLKLNQFYFLKDAGVLRWAGRLRTSRGRLDEEQDTEADPSKLAQHSAADLMIPKELLLLSGKTQMKNQDQLSLWWHTADICLSPTLFHLSVPRTDNTSPSGFLCSSLLLILLSLM